MRQNVVPLKCVTIPKLRSRSILTHRSQSGHVGTKVSAKPLNKMTLLWARDILCEIQAAADDCRNPHWVTKRKSHSWLRFPAWQSRKAMMRKSQAGLLHGIMTIYPILSGLQWPDGHDAFVIYKITTPRKPVDRRKVRPKRLEAEQFGC